MKTFRIFVVVMAICMFMTGCGKHTTPTSTVPSGVTPAATDDTSTTQDNGTTETTSQGNTNSGTSVWASSDSRITPVDINNYWISDTKFDYINYFRDQGATVKYMYDADDGTHKHCLPEELASTGKTPTAICAFFYFGGDSEYVTVYCPFGDAITDVYWVYGEVATFELCQDITYSDDDNVRITIDDYGNTLSLSTVKHLPIISEYMMTLPYNSSVQDILAMFSAHYREND